MTTLKNILASRRIRLSGLVAFVLTLNILPVHAQYQSVAAARTQEKAAEESAISEAQISFIGKRFWVVPNPKAITKLKFLEEDEITKGYAEGFVLTEPMSFTVSGFAKGRYSSENFVKVTFDDGKVAFLEQQRWYEPKDYTHLFENEYSGTEQHYDFVQYVLTASPSDVAATERKAKAKAAAASAAWKARGGVRAGMTAKQVLASNWGRPNSVNRTTGSYGVHEQWVYGDNNYLYFENGVLRTIQN